MPAASAIAQETIWHLDSYRRVNSTLPGNQRDGLLSCREGLLPKAAFVGEDGSASGIFARRLLATGEPLGGEIPVNTTATTGVQDQVALAQFADGGFVVAWRDATAEGGANGIGIRYTRFASNGAPASIELSANSHLAGNQEQPSLDLRRSDDSFVIAWVGVGPGSISGIWFRRFNSSGIPQGAETLVSTNYSFTDVFVTINQNNGSFLVGWSGSDGDGSGVLVRPYDALGNPGASEFTINDSTAGSQLITALAAAPDGSYTVLYTGNGLGDSSGVLGQRLTSTASTLGDEFWVNYNTAGSQAATGVAHDSAGAFLVSWNSNDGAGNFQTFLSHFSAAGQISNAADIPITTSLPAGTDQGFAWLCRDSPSSYRFLLTECATAGDCDEWTQRVAFGLFVDGFEHGDMSAWTLVGP